MDFTSEEVRAELLVAVKGMLFLLSFLAFAVDCL
jgi:hypothetical protein